MNLRMNKVVQMVNKVPFSKIFIDNTKNAIKIPKENYLDDGKIPVVDQGQKYIGGYVNYVKAYTNLPCIIFGDHTRIIKYVDFPFTIGADGVKLLNINNDNFSPKFLYYHLLNFKIPNIGYNRYFKFLKELYFTSYDLQTQQKIVEELDCLSDIIEKKKQQLADLDNLIKSQFIEMFGDSKTTESVRLKDIAQIITGSTPSMAVKDYYKSKDIRFYKPSDLINDINNLKDSDYWISEEARAVAHIVPPNSILVSCIGTVGKIGITNTESTCNQQINAILPNEKFNYIYLAYNIATIKEKLQHIAKAPVVPIINKTTFGNIEIKFETNIELQNQFADFVKHIDKLKFELKQSIEETQNLFNERMQHYFGE